MAGDLALPAAQWAVAAAVKGASTMRPRFAQELEEAIGQWMRSSPRRAPPPPRRPTPAPLHGAALASAASEAGNNIVQAAAPWSGVGATALAALAALSGHPLLGKDLF